MAHWTRPIPNEIRSPCQALVARLAADSWTRLDGRCSVDEGGSGRRLLGPRGLGVDAASLPHKMDPQEDGFQNTPLANEQIADMPFGSVSPSPHRAPPCPQGAAGRGLPEPSMTGCCTTAGRMGTSLLVQVRSGIASHRRPSAPLSSVRRPGVWPKHTHSEALRRHQPVEKAPAPDGRTHRETPGNSQTVSL